LRSAHPYETPCFVSVAAEAVDADYARWIMEETAERD
jgi:uncharacterized protein involved in tolerance to divalent cations